MKYFTLNNPLFLVLSLLTSLFFFNNSAAQEAEKLYHEKFAKMSFTFQRASLTGFDVYTQTPDATPTMAFSNSRSLQIGFWYNFAQYRNFNFKAGIIAKQFTPLFDLQINETQLNSGGDNSEDLSAFPLSEQFVLSQSFRTEYFVSIIPELNLVLGAGLNLDLRTGRNYQINRVRVDIYDSNLEQDRTIFVLEQLTQQITGSLDLSIGVNFESKYGLFQVEMFRNSQLLAYPTTGDFAYNNLNVNDNTRGGFQVRGNYTGFSFTYAPRKGWANKKVRKNLP